MPKATDSTEKPLSRKYRPELTFIPELTAERLAYRKKVARRCRKFIDRFTISTISGLENFPENGPGLIVANHLGDADAVLSLAAMPVQADGLAKVELFDLPVIGRWLHRYGVIWLHRGQADRKAIRSALDGLAEGRFVGIAPEGRQSATGTLEEATGGAAFIALRARVPVIPLAFAGTEDQNVYLNFLRLRKPVMSITFGKPFYLDEARDRATALKDGTEKIMHNLAVLLPEEYRGHYKEV